MSAIITRSGSALPPATAAAVNLSRSWLYSPWYLTCTRTRLWESLKRLASSSYASPVRPDSERHHTTVVRCCAWAGRTPAAAAIAPVARNRRRENTVRLSMTVSFAGASSP